jgi:uncharacterized membrane protein YhaH (DUF805 family)
MMFKNPFSFEGRIRRLEYGLSYIIYTLSIFTIAMVSLAMGDPSGGAIGLLTLILLVPLVWFLLAQGAKRCHDRGNSGWWQIIPFYGIWMLFVDGEIGDNEYGPNPKGLMWDTEAVSTNGEEVKPIDDVDEDGIIKG